MTAAGERIANLALENHKATVEKRATKEQAYWWALGVVNLQETSGQFETTAARVDEEIEQWRSDLTEGALMASRTTIATLRAAHDRAIEGVEHFITLDVPADGDQEAVSEADATISFVHHIAEGVLGALQSVEDIF